MLFNSIEYLIFLPLVFIFYWSLKNNLALQNLFVLVCSYFFYGLWDYRFLSLIIISSLVDFFVGKHIFKSQNVLKRKILLFISLFTNLGFLGYFKYCNFFIESFSNLIESIGLTADYNTLNIILPVGISFYTFQTLSYTIDIYYNKLSPTKSILNFFTYVAFFPQLVAGPIERAKNLLPQIESNRKFSNTLAREGLRQILWGLFKKVVIADNCATLVTPIFDNYSAYGSDTLLIGIFLFAIQIYCDFSGYSDIAIGTAKLLGIRLMQNFATPYFSRDIAEFWRRWHISLSTWFRDYLYIPLGGSKTTKGNQLRNVFVTFIVSGFWHGANWTFIMWGLIHSLLYIPQVLLGTNRNNLDVVAEDQFLPSLKELLQMFGTFIIVCLAWVFFRSPDIQSSFQYLINLFHFDFSLLANISEIKNVSVNDFYLLITFISFSIIIEWLNRKYEYGIYKLPKSKLLRYLIYIVLCFLILQYFYGETQFIYFQF